MGTKLLYDVLGYKGFQVAKSHQFLKTPDDVFKRSSVCFNKLIFLGLRFADFGFFVYFNSSKWGIENSYQFFKKLSIGSEKLLCVILLSVNQKTEKSGVKTM